MNISKYIFLSTFILLYKSQYEKNLIANKEVNFGRLGSFQQ